MITDYGLEVQKTVNTRPHLNNNYYLTLGFSYLAVGTSSTLPDVSQTSLGSEVARTSGNGGFGESETVERNTTNRVIILRGNLVRVINFSASYNLTEFGFFTSSSGANCVYRQLFREDPADLTSNPVVLSVQNGDQLCVSYTVRWIVPVGFFLTKTVTINNSEVTIKVGTCFAGTHPGFLDANLQLFHPSRSFGGNVFIYNSADVSAGDPFLLDTYTPNGSYIIFSGTNTALSGFKAKKSVTFGTSQLNAAIKSLVLSATNNGGKPYSGSVAFVFTPAITKTDLQTLTLSYDLQWDRA
ncbi:hypothetical protein [Thermus phage TSP4]|nr:hypothetical protein [Thermus phage TSP4]